MTYMLHFKFSKFYPFILFSIFYFLFSFTPTEAAKLDLTSQTQEVGIGQQFQVDLLLDTENEAINAVEGRIVFPEDLLELEDIRDGNSIINFWIERPSLNSKSLPDRQAGYILYSGITPGGYLGNQGLILSAIFQAKKEGNGVIEISDARVLLNDGKGTAAETTIFNFQFSIFKQILDSTFYFLDSKKDTDPPEKFQPEIAQSPEMFSGKWFLVFAAQDKGSGIDHYEILEFRKLIKIALYPISYILNFWKLAESPYLLKDQKLGSYIYVKAVDKAGNERITVVEPRYPMRWYGQPLIWGIIILSIIIGYILWKIMKSRIRSTKL